jgi:hypothetical protein
MLKYIPIGHTFTAWWFQTFVIFHFIYGTIHPGKIDFHIFQRGRSTTNQFICLFGLFFSSHPPPNSPWHMAGSKLQSQAGSFSMPMFFERQSIGSSSARTGDQTMGHIGRGQR